MDKNAKPKNISSSDPYKGHQRGERFPFDFLISQTAYTHYELEKVFQQMEEQNITNEMARSRILVHHINPYLVEEKDNDNALAPAEFLAIGVFNEIFHYITSYYAQDIEPDICKQIKESALHNLGKSQLQNFLQTFLQEFLPLEITRNQANVPKLLGSSALSFVILAESIHLYFLNQNPAIQKYRVLYNDKKLKDSGLQQRVEIIMQEQLNASKGIGNEEKKLFDFLYEPLHADTNSIFGQLEYIYNSWAYLLPAYLLKKLLYALDSLREENFSRGFFPPAGLRDTFAPNYFDLDLFPEYEAFTADRDWMPNVVLLAKNAYVWLYQLSQKYNREIKTLDQIPNQELDILAHRGFTALWLIGLWQRSEASARIKHLCGNPQAIASAYSIFDYIIDYKLGGEEAIENLSHRCLQRGIRLASDMVPNHMGIFSQWIQNHPDYFLELDYCPFPGYNFNGENLSQNPHLGIYIEDGYYSRSDAAVVFKRVDFSSGRTTYIYHGNDGTSMPWNDTAQLDYLKPQVREAVMQQILRVAKHFSVIRFDAAMTLTKKHIQRLWYPLPGSGGAIPTRADFSLSADDFHNAIPNEFWREVVDRMAKESPDTLLLAEAFWLLEGFFVRTLGMHRVYNSAFMNMLYKEENAKYRYLIRETLEFEPEILKRYTNFMTNPDEETAIEQFGSGERYFGTALMMVTLPGLPMWGHGQVEGFREKYGMEYFRSYYEEEEDTPFIQHHERTIFPLMHKRYLFSGVENFQLFDFEHRDGYIDENVFAYSNRVGKEKSLIIFNNRYADTAGRIYISVEKLQKESGVLQKVNLATALDLKNQENYFFLFRDQMTGLEYIRENRDLYAHGLFVLLRGHQAHAFWDMREVYDPDGHWRNICNRLQGAGVENLEEYYRETRYQKQISALLPLFAEENLILFYNAVQEGESDIASQLQSAVRQSILALSEFFCDSSLPQNKTLANLVSKQIEDDLLASLALLKTKKTKRKKELLFALTAKQEIFFLYMFSVLSNLGALRSPENIAEQSARWFDEWVLYKRVQKTFFHFEVEAENGFSLTALVRLSLRYKNWLQFCEQDRSSEWVHGFFANYATRAFLRVHQYAGVTYFQKEQLEIIFSSLFLLAPLNSSAQAKSIREGEKLLQTILLQAQARNYSLHALLQDFPIQEKLDDEKKVPTVKKVRAAAGEKKPPAEIAKKNVMSKDKKGVSIKNESQKSATEKSKKNITQKNSEKKSSAKTREQNAGKKKK